MTVNMFISVLIYYLLLQYADASRFQIWPETNTSVSQVVLTIYNDKTSWNRIVPAMPPPCPLYSMTDNIQTHPATVTSYDLISSQPIRSVLVTAYTKVISCERPWYYPPNRDTKLIDEYLEKFPSDNHPSISVILKTTRNLLMSHTAKFTEIEIDVTESSMSCPYFTSAENNKRLIIRFRIIDTLWSRKNSLVDPIVDTHCHFPGPCKVSINSILHSDQTKIPSFNCAIKPKVESRGYIMYPQNVQVNEIKFIDQDGVNDLSFDPNTPVECLRENILIYVSKEGMYFSISLESFTNGMYKIKTLTTKDFNSTYSNWIARQRNKIEGTGKTKRSVVETSSLSDVPLYQRDTWIHNQAVSRHTYLRSMILRLSNYTYRDLVLMKEASCELRRNAIIHAYYSFNWDPRPYLGLILGHDGFITRQDGIVTMFAIGKRTTVSLDNFKGSWEGDKAVFFVDGLYCLVSRDTGETHCKSELDTMGSSPEPPFLIPHTLGGSIDLLTNKTYSSEDKTLFHVKLMFIEAGGEVKSLIDTDLHFLKELEGSSVISATVLSELPENQANSDGFWGKVGDFGFGLKWARYGALGFGGITILNFIPWSRLVYRKQIPID